MKKNILFFILCSLSVVVVLFQFNCEPQEKTMTKEELIAKGKYLVNLGGCNDCHSPKVMTNMGPVPDTTRLLSGHPANEPTPELDLKAAGLKNWVLSSMDLTEWLGPWGISFTRNLTPDSTTGIGAWSFQDFVNTLRNGKHLGTGRNLLPPMPWEPLGHVNDADLKAIFTYLQSLPAIHNEVPNPVPPPMVADYFKKK
jgi:mono/diheme cytochrome c family protein